MVVGFFNPHTALFWYKKERTKKASLRLNGLVCLFSFILCAVIIPPSANKGKVKEDVAQQEGEKPPTNSETAAEKSPVYEVANVEHLRGDIYCKVVMQDLYSRDELIEKTRELKDKYQAKEKFACYFYYKKYAEKTLPVAGSLYLEDCSNCEFKDKQGDPLNFPFYHLQKPRADSLRALHFDTTGFKVETAFLDQGFKTRNSILSSDNAKALLILQDPGGHVTFPLVKKVMDGQERFYDPEEKGHYYVINRQEGLVEYYKEGALNLQQIIED